MSVTDERGNYLISYNGNFEDTVYCEFELKGTENKIIITPVVYIDGNEKYLEDEEIVIEILITFFGNVLGRPIGGIFFIIWLCSK